MYLTMCEIAGDEEKALIEADSHSHCCHLETQTWTTRYDKGGTHRIRSDISSEKQPKWHH